MAFEADWLEREERYRRRVVRLLALGFVVAGAAIGVAGFLHGRAAQRARVAGVAAAQAARDAEAQRVRDAFVADSSAAADRNLGFLTRTGASVVSGTPLIQIPLPAGTAVSTYVKQLWPEYARVFDPEATPEQVDEWYRKYYVDVANDGPLRPRAILFPAIDQVGTKLSIVRPTFPQIAAAQIAIGMRIPAPPDSSALLGTPVEPAAAIPPGTPPATLPATSPPVPDSVPPPITAPPVTAPPVTEPPITELPITEPPVAPVVPDSATNRPRT